MTASSTLIAAAAAAVPDLLEAVSELFIQPAFQNLARSDIREKTPGELATTVDEQVEAFVSEKLAALEPGAMIVGEEAAARDPNLIGHLGQELVWLIDPLDGTANFVSTSQDYGVMVALVESGTTVASWIYVPGLRRHYTAALGGGAFCNGRPIRVSVRQSQDPARLRGAILSRFIPEDLKSRMLSNAGRFAAISEGTRCAAIEYPAIVSGQQDFALFWRTLPWDHAPGCLFLREAGGHVARLDGRYYDAKDEGSGLLAAASTAIWESTLNALMAV